MNPSPPLTARSVQASTSTNWTWTKYATMICGAWVASSAILSQPGNWQLFASDIASGLAIVLLSILSLNPKLDWLRWITAMVGTWLLFAPLLFWAPTAYWYNNDTLLGTLVIAFAFLLPGQPGVKTVSGGDVPPGWTYNPSSWAQRGPLIAIALLGFFMARYLAAYQMGHINTIWDPFFADGTKRVLTSDVSKAFLISDAGLGAVSYLIDALEGFLGRQNRWRTMPWAVVVFAATIVPAGITSVVLVMLQPIAVGAWCTVCLLTAVLMLIMVPFAADELIATVQFLMQARREGKPFWKTFFFGDHPESVRIASADTTGETGSQTGLAQGLSGVNFPVTLLFSAVLGIWLMASPAVLSIAGTGSDSQHLMGAIVVTIAVSAMAEACRAVRFLNIAVALWLMVSPLVLADFSTVAAWSNAIVAVLLVLSSIPKGRIQYRYGSWDRFVI